jgi:hypothetical protein
VQHTVTNTVAWSTRINCRVFVILSHCLFQFWSVQEGNFASNDFQVRELFSILYTGFGLLEVWTNRAFVYFPYHRRRLKEDYVHGPLVGSPGTGCSPPFLPSANTARIFPCLTFFSTFFIFFYSKETQGKWDTFRRRGTISVVFLCSFYVHFWANSKGESFLLASQGTRQQRLFTNMYDISLINDLLAPLEVGHEVDNATKTHSFVKE